MLLKDSSRRSIAGMMIGGGSICALAALVSLLFGWRFVHSAARADARVIQMVEKHGEYGKLHAPVFVFRDANGAEYTVRSKTGTNPPKYQVGDTVSVLYSPENPERAKIDWFFSLWGLPFVTGLLAAFHLPVGLLVWYWPSLVQRFRHAPSEIE